MQDKEKMAESHKNNHITNDSSNCDNNINEVEYKKTSESNGGVNNEEIELLKSNELNDTPLPVPTVVPDGESEVAEHLADGAVGDRLVTEISARLPDEIATSLEKEVGDVNVDLNKLVSKEIDKISILKVLGEYGIDTKEETIESTAYHIAQCPFCNSEHQTLIIDIKENTYNCRKCQEHGDVVDFIVKKDGSGITEALKKLKISEHLLKKLQSDKKSNKEYVHKRGQEIEIKEECQHEEIAKIAEERFSKAHSENVDHSYLQNKGVKAAGEIKVDNNLLIPMYDINDKLWNLQRIFEIDGEIKKYPLKGGRVKGCFFYIVTPHAIWHLISHVKCVLYKTLQHQIFSFA